tara:strand:+ start:4188 stop:4568 length:381 start_codon:yes stop_codon:yes gene_type:complete
MFEKLDVLTLLRDRAVELNDNNLTNLPDEHKNTSLESGAKCDLSYHQGYRDGIQSLLSIINTWWQNEHDDMEEESDRMYLDYLQTRCHDIYLKAVNKNAKPIDFKNWTKINCIKFLKETGNWVGKE